MSEQDKLDVDFEIIEEPQDIMFPRLPNVVSHRGHKVKILAIIRNVPEPEQETTISLRAKIMALARKTMGEKEHVSCPAQIWGEAPEVKAKFPSEDFPTLPFSMHIIVPRKNDDDHLGEGPHYQAFVNVTTSSGGEMDAAGAGGGGQKGGRAVAEHNSGFDDDGLYIIEFISK